MICFDGCLLLPPLVAAARCCLLLPPLAAASCCCLLLLPLAAASCCCLSLLPLALSGCWNATRHRWQAKVWLGQRGVVMPLHYDTTDNLYVMAWGRKRAILAEPGQLDTLYRFPNAHPLVGSSQVNLTAPDLTRHPRFEHARLREAIVGPGDVLYLPSWWWHQARMPPFTQPMPQTHTRSSDATDFDSRRVASLGLLPWVCFVGSASFLSLACPRVWIA